MTAVDFREVGASGQKYGREYVIKTLLDRYSRGEDDAWATSDFWCRHIGADTYLLTYLLDHKDRLSRRLTIWRRAEGDWVALYHQGTLVIDNDAGIAKGVLRSDYADLLDPECYGDSIFPVDVPECDSAMNEDLPWCSVMGFFRHPGYPGTEVHQSCGYTWHDHGWIDSRDITVCPSSWGPFPGQTICESGQGGTGGG
jgi:hypothetical protein